MMTTLFLLLLVLQDLRSPQWRKRKSWNYCGKMVKWLCRVKIKDLLRNLKSATPVEAAVMRLFPPTKLPVERSNMSRKLLHSICLCRRMRWLHGFTTHSMTPPSNVICTPISYILRRVLPYPPLRRREKAVRLRWRSVHHSHNHRQLPRS